MGQNINVLMGKAIHGLIGSIIILIHDDDVGHQSIHSGIPNRQHHNIIYCKVPFLSS